jgi:hypothetical protein
MSDHLLCLDGPYNGLYKPPVERAKRKKRPKTAPPERRPDLAHRQAASGC